MSKKHFEKAAALAREIKDDKERLAVIRAFAELFRNENPRFDSPRFLAACQPKEAR